MATIHERKSRKGEIRYTVEIRLKGFPAQSATFDRKTDAKLWAQQTESAIREGRYFKTAQAKKHTLKDVIERYKTDALPKRHSDFKKIETHLEWWSSKIGAYLLSDVTAVLLSEYRDRLTNEPNQRGLIRSNATVNRYMASLSIALSQAVEWGWIEENPLFKVKKMSEPRGRVRFLSEEEKEALLKACKQSASPHLYNVVVLALSTGARYGEIINLVWQEVDLKHKMIRLENTKNDERRAIPVSGPALEILQTLHKTRKLHIKYVFPSQNGKKPADIQDAWDWALKRAKLKDFRFHDLRHTAASYLAMNGATLTEISTILGHKTLAMVKRYSHLTEQHTAQVLERMNEKMFEIAAK